ncbi:MAG: tyrosine-type recombinase/integrase [Deltaproteobacteria bacterium]|jgi:integrase|nr:tyrosine-type recombinase/integrase [Deltaproteobacteria bacterium]
MKVKITQKFVNDIKPENKAVKVWDTITPGLFLYVFPSGTKTYYINIRLTKWKSRRKSIGRHPTMTAEKAREIASRWYSLKYQGIDPVAEIKKKNELDEKSVTMAELAEMFLAEHAEKKKKETYNKYKVALNKYILPEFKGKKINNIEKSDIENMLLKIGKGYKTVYNRTAAILSVVFSFAERVGYMPRGSNPCFGIKKEKEFKRKRYPTYEELQHLGKILNEYEEYGGNYTKEVRIIKLLLYTGARKSEIIKGEWEWVNWERKVYAIRDPKSNEPDEEMQLPNIAIELLQQIYKERNNDSKYIFPGVSPDKHKSLKNDKIWNQIRKKAGLENLRKNDLRHGFATYAGLLSRDLAIVRDLLRHEDIKTTQRYAHVMNDPLQAAANATANKIKELLEK